MPINIEPIGGYSEISSEGSILNSCHKNNIPSLWLTPVEDLVVYYQKLHKENLASVYLRGSVPRGTMVNAISDIDSFCLTHTEASEDVTTSVEQYQSDFVQKYSFVAGVEIESFSVERALHMKSIFAGPVTLNIIQRMLIF